MIESLPSTKQQPKGPEANNEVTAKVKSFELKKNDKYYAWLFLGPSILLLTVFVFFPMLRTLYLSLFLTDTFGNPTVFIGLKNYTTLLKSTSYIASLKATGTYVISVSVFTIIFGLLLAALANQKLRGISFFRNIFTATMGVSVSVSAVFWLFMFNPSLGILNKVVVAFGFHPINWLTTPGWAMTAVIATTVWMHLGFTFLLFFGALQAVPKSLYDAAAVSGATSRYQFRHITLPMISPTMFFVAVITLISGFKSFGLIDLMTGGGPTNATNLLVYRVYKDAFMNGNYAQASTEAIILTIIIAIITFVQFKLLAKRVNY